MAGTSATIGGPSRLPFAVAVVVVVLTLLAATRGVTAVWLHLPPSGTKCVSELLPPNEVVFANYAVINGDYSVDQDHVKANHYEQQILNVTVKVTSPSGNTLHHKENFAMGEFGFITSEHGYHLACFSADTGKKDVGADLVLDWRIGLAAKDWTEVAKKQKIEGVELELTKLGEIVLDVHQKMLHLVSREFEMRQVSRKTNGRVAWLSIMSLAVCVVASVLQLRNLKRFFQKKKLI